MSRAGETDRECLDHDTPLILGTILKRMRPRVGGETLADPRRERLQAFYPTVLGDAAEGDLEGRLRQFVASDDVDLTEEEVRGGLSFRWTLESIRSLVDAFAGTTAQARQMAFVGDTACVRWTVTGRHVAPYAGYPATEEVASIEGVDVVKFDGDVIARHVGWIDQEALNAALGRPSGESQVSPQSGEARIAGSRAVERALTSAGEALETVAQQHTAPDQPFGWRLELDAPRWALSQSTDRGFLPALLLAFGAALLGGALLLLLWLLRDDGLSETVTTSLAVGGGTAALALALVSWRSIASWRSMSRVQVDVRRSVPVRMDVTYEHSTDQPDDENTRSGHRESQNDNVRRTVRKVQETDTTQQDEAPGSSGPVRTTPSNVAGKEPVLLGSTLIGGGTLALGLAGLEGETVGAIAAAAIAGGGLLVRQLVTSLFDPRDNQQQALRGR